MSSELTFSPATAEEVTADVEAEAVLLISQSAGVDTSQVTFTLSEGARHRRARQLRQSSVAVALEVIFYLNDLEVDRVRNKSAADPDAFITTVMNNPDSLFAAATEAFLKNTDPQVTCTMVTATDLSCGSCPRGYAGDGYVSGGSPGCVDVDECALNNPCDPLVTCTNLPGGVECGVCPEGFAGTGLAGCQEITGSCAERNGGCWTNGKVSAECSDVDAEGMQLASPVCGRCPAGYEDSPGSALGTACVDIDGCAVPAGAPGHCAEGSTCLDVAAPGTGLTCSECFITFTGDGYNPERYPGSEGCYPDACFTSNGGCSTNPAVKCTNVRDAMNGRVCGPGCPVGYTDVYGDATVCEDEKSCELYPCFSSVLLDPPVSVACRDLPAPATGPDGRVCGPCPEASIEMTSAATSMLAGACFGASTVLKSVAVGCTYEAFDPTVDGVAAFDWTCPEGYKGDGVDCVACSMLVRITNATVVDGATNRAGWNLDKTLQVMGQLTGLDSPACTDLQGTYFRWVASVSDGSELVLGEINKASTRTLTVFKSQLKVKRNYIISFQGILRGNPAVTGAAALPFYVKSLPIASSMTGGDVVTGDRAAVIINASGTYDPDGQPGEIAFSWRCRIDGSTSKCMTRSPADPTIGEPLPSSLASPVLNLTMLGGGGGDPINYTFTLTATKGDRSTVVSTRLSIFQGGAPVPSIAALVCSQPPCKANPDTKLTLRASVASDDPAHLWTLWSVEAEPEENAFEISSETCLTSPYNRVTVRLSVIDNFDAVGQFEVNVTVRPQAVLVTDNVLKSAVIASLSGDTDNVMTLLTDESQTSALGMYSSMSSGTAVYSTMADSVCSGLSSLNVANSQSAARRRRHLLQADADPELHAEATAAAAQRASEVVQVLADLGGSMLSGAVADEVPVSTHSPTLAMKVGRTRADLPDSTLYAAPVDTGDGSLNQVQFPASMGAALASAAEAVARRRRDLLLTSSDSDLDSESETDLEDEDVLPEQEVSLRVLTTSGEIHQSNASAPGYATSGAAGILSAGGVQQVVLGAGNAELAVSGLEEAIEIVMQLDEEQLASHKRRLLNSDDPVGRLECRFWSPVLDAYSTAGCVTLPNPAPAGAQLRWQTKNISSIEDISLAWEVGNHTMTRGCTEHFNAVLDPAIWGGRDAGYRKWAAPAGKDGVYVDNAGCQLIDNSSYPGGCRWQWTTSMFVGTDCVTAPALECLCTHLTDFKVPSDPPTRIPSI
eukprot:gene1560-2193_t